MISVIIPTYNNGKYIKEAIDSVLEQTYKDYEIIVIDDGSTDNTKEIVLSYGAKVKYIYQKNQGLPTARNKGIEYASGKYFTFLDGDDKWYPENLELKAAILEKNQDIGAVFSDFTLFSDSKILYESGIHENYIVFHYWFNNIQEVFENKSELLLENNQVLEYYHDDIFSKLLLGNFINACSILIRKKDQEEIGSFRADLITQQDYEYWLRFSQKFKMAYIHRPLVYYRRHPDQLTDKKNSTRIISYVEEILTPYFEDIEQKYEKKDWAKLNRRFSLVLKARGVTFLKQKQRKQAFSYFLRSLNYELKMDGIALLIISLFPNFIIKMVLKTKNQ